MSLLRPAVLPDELASSYEGRLLRYNGWAVRQETRRWLHQWFDDHGTQRRELTTVELLARVADIDTTRFVQSHTTMPLQRAVAALIPDLPHGSEEHAALLRTMPMRAMRPGAYFCGSCVEEDLDFHGMAYWRRSHQLPGVFWCSKHGDPLSLAGHKCVDAGLRLTRLPTLP